MRRITLLFFIIGSFNCYVFAQNDTSVSSKNIFKHHTIIFSPFNMFDFFNPNIQLGYEYYLTKKWTLQVEGAYIIDHSILNWIADFGNGIKNCPYSNKGFSIRLGFKYMVYQNNRFSIYVSNEIFYRRNESYNSRIYLLKGDDILYNDFFYNDEKKAGLNFRFGWKLNLGESVVFEPNVGIGIAYKQVIQKDRDRPEDQLYYDFLNLNSASKGPWALNLPFNIKFGYRF